MAAVRVADEFAQSQAFDAYADNAVIPDGLVDISEWIAEPDAAHTVRCCCDAPKWEAMHWHALSEHSHRCFVDFRPFGHCRDFGKDGRPWQLGNMHHYSHTGNKCRIALEEVETVVRFLGRANPSFCEEVPPDSAGLALVPAARLDEDVPVSCALGFIAATPRVTCSYRANGTRFRSPDPRCDRIPDYCAAVLQGPMSVAAASVGDVVDILCTFSTLETAQVTCGDDAKFTPHPRCAAPPEDATARAAEIERLGHGRCCCDRQAGGLLGWLAGSDAEDPHSGQCHIVLGVSQCKSVSATSRLVHYKRTVAEKCIIFH